MVEEVGESISTLKGICAKFAKLFIYYPQVAITFLSLCCKYELLSSYFIFVGTIDLVMPFHSCVR